MGGVPSAGPPSAEGASDSSEGGGVVSGSDDGGGGGVVSVGGVELAAGGGGEGGGGALEPPLGVDVAVSAAGSRTIILRSAFATLPARSVASYRTVDSCAVVVSILIVSTFVPSTYM